MSGGNGKNPTYYICYIVLLFLKRFRWCIVRPGKLVYYTSENKELCFGIVLLEGCQVTERKTKKEGIETKFKSALFMMTKISPFFHFLSIWNLESLSSPVETHVFSFHSLRKGFCFKIFHPTSRSIYSTRGLKGESLASMKVPGNLEECIIRCKTEEEGLAKISNLDFFFFFFTCCLRTYLFVFCSITYFIFEILLLLFSFPILFL